MVQAAPAWRSAGRTFFDQPGQVLTVAGNGLASYPAIARAIPRVEITASAARAGRASPAPPGSRPTGRTEGRSRRMLSSRHLPRRWKRRYGFGKVGSRTLPFGAKRQQSPQEWSGGPRLRGCTADAKTAFRCHGLAKGGAMAGEHRQAARRRRIRGRRSARLSDAVLRGREIADVSAAEERDRVALGQVGRSNAGKSGVVGKCPQGRASTGNASDRRSSLIARYPRRFAH